MNVLDVALVSLAIFAGVTGYRLGLVTRAVSWAGLIAGLGIGTRLLPGVLRSVRSNASHAQLFTVAAVVLLACGITGQVIGLLLGSRVAVRVHSPAGRRVDQVSGAVAGVLGLIAATWLLLPSMTTAPGWPSRLARESALAHALTDVLPQAPETSRAMRRLVGQGYPEVFDALRPTPDLGRPPEATGLSATLARRVARSTVKVAGRACRLVQEGSGFVVEPHVVATNAHVVAGEETTYVDDERGHQLEARVVAFDPRRDLALLWVPDLDAPPLPRGQVGLAGAGAVFGHPEGGPLSLTPFRVADKVRAVGRDIYDRGVTSRLVLILASRLEPGDSGGALVDPQGRLVGVAFAVAPDRPGVSYALDLSELSALLTVPHHGAVDTGACVG